jgi:LuxR family transcriptional regulator, quorum-sensing system regulator BjaR1
VSQREIEQLTLDFVSKLDTAPTTAAVTPLFEQYASKLGFSNAICMRVPETGEQLGDAFLLNSFPKNWVSHYDEQGYITSDPVVRELFLTYQPFSWSEVLARRDIGPLERKIMAECADAGMRDGFVVPIYQGGGYTGLVSFAGHDPMITEESRSSVTLASIYLHNKLNTLRRHEAQNTYDLTERELECLRWAAAGKSDWEIGQILLISSKTVNYHIENAKRKFGVATRVQAIVSALRIGRLGS